ncbi:GLPGLI family protein [Bacteroidales bacterium OttesenSCG-928-K22]|nr:GLPGLI family protein [Bacteroidales bacterium OttesenSCG-928-L14]MDL2240202.1 GLPGLI family protein [Bacteroidales bacterium OttesenSCG-928-K22]
MNIKKISLILLTPLLLLQLYGQQQYLSQYFGTQKYIGGKALQVIDSAKFRITYSLEYVSDSLDSQNVFQDRKVLLIGDSISHFYSYYAWQADSSVTSDYDRGASYINYLKYPPNVFYESYEIYNNYPIKGQRTVSEWVTDKYFCQYKELINEPLWTITTDTLSIALYLCIKATCNYRGRNWEVWFTPSVPINAGPWKLSGLPGLILKASDDRQHYVFVCSGIEDLRKQYKLLPITYIKARNECTRGEYIKLQKRYYEDRTNALLGFGYNVNIKDDNDNTIERIPNPNRSDLDRVAWSKNVYAKDRYKKLPYNPIELE